MSSYPVQNDTVLLQIPYDRIRTDDAPSLIQATDAISDADVSHYLQRLPEDVQAAHCIAATCGLLYRYTGQANVAVNLYCARSNLAAAISGRISVGLAGDTEFRELSTEVADKLARVLAAPAAETPVSITVWRDGDDSVHSIDSGRSDLNFRFNETSGAWRFDVLYDSKVLDGSTARQILSHLRNFLRSCISDPDSRLSAVEIYTPAEQDWYDAVTTGSTKSFPDTLVHQEIEKWARKEPDRTAVRFSDAALTYNELNQAANRLASFLIDRGIAANSRIIVCVEPSFDIIVSLLAIFKSGATYVPLNPSFPQHRIDTVIEDTAPVLIITQSALLDRFQGCSSITIAVDSINKQLATRTSDNPDVPIAFSQNAYIYYTSGTTGKPKGARATYANLVHFTQVSRNAYGFGSSDVMPAVASFTFSISMFELISPLAAGGTLIILERREVLDPESMCEVLQQVSVAHIGPSLLKNIMRYIRVAVSDFSAFAGLRHISSGGDMIPPELLCDMQQVFQWSEIYVIYGCSEISLMGCTWRVDNRATVSRTYVGKPFENVCVELLDDDGNRVPVGAVGNVCFSGGGVVDGYLNRPELTARLFFQRGGRTFYSTGDRGRFSAEGDLELLGRRDFQVKIRGMRVELGEIDYHLRQAIGVRDGVVASARWDGRDNVLVGYYVRHSGATADSGSIRNHMLSRLPDYMVPTYFVELDALPLNLNLKVDRNALPDFDPAFGLIEPPESETEKELASIWCELLQLPQVGRGDNFLLLGGDSLLAMELILIVQQRLNVKLDGMEILRESLQVIAAICDRELKGTVETREAPQAPQLSVRKVFKLSRSLYFGARNELYGVYHPPAGSTTGNGLLICPPFGQEYVRCHYFLKMIADVIAGHGMPVLRFDYFATGDSLGDDLAGSPARWQNDIEEAYRLLQQESKSIGITVLGARLGASFALKSLSDTPVSRWVLWDPVISGLRHIEEQRRMHAQKENKLLVTRDLRKPKARVSSEELLGYSYSNEAVRELEALHLGASELPAGSRLHHVLSFPAAGISGLTDEWTAALSSDDVACLNVDCRWYDSTRMTSAITHKSLAMALVDRVRGEKN